MSNKRKRWVSEEESLILNYISSENGTVVPSDSFTGLFVYCTQYTTVLLSCFSNTSGTLLLDQSFDGFNISDSETISITANTAFSNRFQIFYPYVRVRWNSVGNTNLKIYCLLTHDNYNPITTLSSASGDESLVKDGIGPDLITKALSAGTGITLSSNANHVHIAVTDPYQVTTLGTGIGDESLVHDSNGPAIATKALSAGTGISLSSNTQHVTISNSAPDQVVSLTAGSNVTISGSYPNFTISSSGGGGSSVFFKAYNSTTRINVTGDSTWYTIPFDTVVTNVGGGYSTVTNSFTPPINGLYLFTGGLYVENVGSHPDGIYAMSISSSATWVFYIEFNPNNYRSNSNMGITGSGLMYCTTSDIITLKISFASGTKTINVYGDANIQATNFGGYYIGS